jgi:hypothetical protein
VVVNHAKFLTKASIFILSREFGTVSIYFHIVSQIVLIIKFTAAVIIIIIKYSTLQRAGPTAKWTKR